MKPATLPLTSEPRTAPPYFCMTLINSPETPTLPHTAFWMRSQARNSSWPLSCLIRILRTRAPEERTGLCSSSIRTMSSLASTGWGRRLCDFAKRKFLIKCRVRLPVDFDIGVDEIVERRPVLLGRQGQIAANGELHAVRIQRAEKVIVLGRILPGFGDIHRNPARAAHIKFRPTMVTGDFTLLRVFGKREADFKPGGDVFRAHHGNKQRVKISAIAVLRIARPKRIAAPPARARFVIAQSFENVIIERVRLLHRALFAPGILFRQLLHFSVNRNQLVGLEKSLDGGGSPLRVAIVTHQLFIPTLGVLLAGDLILQ